MSTYKLVSQVNVWSPGSEEQTCFPGSSMLRSFIPEGMSHVGKRPNPMEASLNCPGSRPSKALLMNLARIFWGKKYDDGNRYHSFPRQTAPSILAYFGLCNGLYISRGAWYAVTVPDVRRRLRTPAKDAKPIMPRSFNFAGTRPIIVCGLECPK